MTSDKIASVAFENMSTFHPNKTFHGSKLTSLNLLPIKCKTITDKTRVVPKQIPTSQLPDLSKMELEFLNVKLSLEGRNVTENAFKDYREMYKLFSEVKNLAITLFLLF